MPTRYDRRMAYDEDLAARIRDLIGPDPDLTEKKMFGGLAFLIRGHMAISASGQGGVLVHVDPGSAIRRSMLACQGRAGRTAGPDGAMTMVMPAMRTTAADLHIAAGRGRAGGRSVTGPARRALTWLTTSSPAGSGPPPAGPRNLRCWIAARPCRAGGAGGDAAPDPLRTCPPDAERDDRPSTAVPSRREGGSCRGHVEIAASSAR